MPFALQCGLTTKRAGNYRPVFFGRLFFKLLKTKVFGANFALQTEHVALQDIVEKTVTGFGYDLVEIERSAGGLLRVTIDLPWVPGVEQFINVEDCEKVTRQLQFVLEVDGIEYKRLEVSSPGIDRPLRGEKDFERFVGETVDITLKAPMGAAAAGQVAANRKKFRGTLERVAPVVVPGAPAKASEAQAPPGWQIVWSDAPPVKPGQKVSKKRAPAPLSALGFRLDELRDARLAPIVSFKGRGTKDDGGAES
jgi:ribosome maturation factor RimP